MRKLPSENKIAVYGIALMMAHNGFIIINPFMKKLIFDLPQKIYNFQSWQEIIIFLGVLEIPNFMIGFLILLMSCVILMRTRISWIFSIILLISMIFLNIFISKNAYVNSFYQFITLSSLIFYWKIFYKNNIGSTSILSIASIVSLIFYGVLGSLYLGDQFTPKIESLPDAFYFVIVCMSTVGFGDIVPHTSFARIFTVTVIIFGITIFAASVASIAGSLIRNNISHILHGGLSHVSRNNHYIIIGSSSLTQNVCQVLFKNGTIITVICPPGSKNLFSKNMDVIEGDPSSAVTLKSAGADKAKYIVTLMENDAENAFNILAAKEIADESTKIISLVNKSQNITKIKGTHPDGILSLEELCCEIIVRTLNGDSINNDVLESFFSKTSSND